jgi:UDP-GlcNAc:undecaprenyl-phosphate GlcNAc-1-phosphate transferase
LGSRESPDQWRSADAQAVNTLLEGNTDLLYKRRLFEVLLDVVLIAFAYYSAYMLRWDAKLPGEQLAIFARTLPLVTLVQLAFFMACGVYRGFLPYVGIDHLLVIARSVFMGTLISWLAVLALYRFHGPSHAVLVHFMMLAIIFVGGSRLSLKQLRALLVGRVNRRPEGKPVLFYEMGDGEEVIIPEILNDAAQRLLPVGFIHGDDRKAGSWIHGHRIFRRWHVLALIARRGVRGVRILRAKIPTMPN